MNLHLSISLSKGKLHKPNKLVGRLLFTSELLIRIDYIKNNNLSYQYKIKNIKLKLTISINLHVSQIIIFM